DVTVQAQVLQLLAGLRREFGLSLLLITHDLGVMAQVCDRALVMYAGRCVEHGTAAELLAAPRHPYTRGLLNSRPRLDRPVSRRLSAIAGSAANAAAGGCAFAPRCPSRAAACSASLPLEQSGSAGGFSCHFPLPGANAVAPAEK
ncbi:MAG TPA: oligopeptide/dipeptide ABC transporter ATP-binding protein, partial [Nevskiaceae bacterium]|nr:oligopeptide/dipeptide ABC transporter ATP-binding protein [Nevskiaceae bacterium]